MKNKNKIIVSVVGRLTVFFYIFTVLILILYLQGSFQDFLDESLINLLVLYKYTALIFLAFGVSYIITILTAGKKVGKNMVKRIIITITGIILSSVFLLLAEIIITGLEPVT